MSKSLPQDGQSSQPWTEKLVGLGIGTVLSFIAKLVFVAIFFVIVYIARQIALPEELTIAFAIIGPFAALGGVVGAIRYRETTLAIGVLRGMRQSLLIAFLFFLGICSLGTVVAYQSGKELKTALLVFPLLSLNALTVIHVIYCLCLKDKNEREVESSKVLPATDEDAGRSIPSHPPWLTGGQVPRSSESHRGSAPTG
jgi:hypothetical protein